MIFSGMEQMKQAPFHTVFINGIIRDSQGRKMSKSLGNGIDPIDMIEKYGADALRFNIITGNSPGNDTRFYPERCEAMRNFANKIWNASRFVLMNLTDGWDTDPAFKDGRLPGKLELEDKWILSKLNTLAAEVSENLEKFEIGVAAAKIYDFIWDSYCDWYIELSKPRLAAGGAAALGAQKVLLYVLTEILTLLHPFMPFITEEIYQALPRENVECRMQNAEIRDGEGAADAANAENAKIKGGDGAALMVRKYTGFQEELRFPEEEADFESVMAAIRAVRARRAEMHVPPSKKPSLTIVTDKPEVFEAGRVYIGRLAYAGELTITKNAPGDLSGFVTVVTNDARLFIPLSELVDAAKERERIEKEIDKAQADIARVTQKLSNEQFMAKAPDAVVQTEREKLSKLQALMDNLNDSLEGL